MDRAKLKHKCKNHCRIAIHIIIIRCMHTCFQDFVIEAGQPRRKSDVLASALKRRVYAFMRARVLEVCVGEER